jgi:hypothetical protein
VFDLQLHDGAGPVTVDVASAGKAEIPAEPAIGEVDADRVRTLGKQVGDVVRVVAQPVVVAGPAGRQDGVAHDRTVELRLVDPVGGGVETRSGNWTVYHELPPKQGGRLTARTGCRQHRQGDPSGPVVRPE